MPLPPMMMSPWSVLTAPGASGNQMMDAVGALSGGRAQQGAAAMGAGGSAPMETGRIDISGALGTGTKAAGGMPGAEDDDASDSGGGGDMGFSPGFMKMVKHAVQSDNEPLSSQDKGLALAQAGFGMAASGAHTFGQSLGEGAVYGIKGLQDLQKQRAQERMKRDALAQTSALREEAIARQTAADKQASIDRQAAIQQRADAALQHSQDAAAAEADRKTAAANTLAETNARHAEQAQVAYESSARARDAAFYATGSWHDLPGDADHGITGRPVAEDRPVLPMVTDPKTPPKTLQKLDEAHPKAYQTLQTFLEDSSDAITKANALSEDKRLPADSGASGVIGRNIPILSTDAKNFEVAKHSLISDLKLNALAQLKALSANGSTGLGRVTNIEFSAVGSKIADLESAQNADQLKTGLKNVADYLKQAAEHTRDGYIETYGDTYRGKKVPELPWEADKGDAKTLTPLERAEKALKDAGH